MTTFLPTTRLGRTGLHLTRVGFGAWAIGGGGWDPPGATRTTRSIAAIRHAVESGINWIDTAAVYGLGHSEEVVAAAWADLPEADRPASSPRAARSGIGRPVRSAPAGRRACQPHDRGRGLTAAAAGRADRPVPDAWPAEDGTPLEEYWQVFTDLKREGKIRAAGCPTTASSSWRRPRRSARCTPSSRRST